MSSNWGRSLAHVKPPTTFATVQVRDIGLRSFSMAPGGHTLRTGVTMEDLSRDGICPSLTDNWSQFRCKLLFKILFGMLSGPLLNSDITILNFSSHEDASKIADQSYGVSYRPNARHALSRISRVIKGSAGGGSRSAR